MQRFYKNFVIIVILPIFLVAESIMSKHQNWVSYSNFIHPFSFFNNPFPFFSNIIRKWCTHLLYWQINHSGVSPVARGGTEWKLWRPSSSRGVVALHIRGCRLPLLDGWTFYANVDIWGVRPFGLGMILVRIRTLWCYQFSGTL